MGCDIHLYVEVKDGADWKSLREPVPNPYYDESEPEEDRESPTNLPRSYSGRNYGLFAILADVRNGHGFAGTDLGDSTKPIAQPRGLPSDVSTAIGAESEQWGVDGHSHSYFTLAELYAHDWSSPVVNRSQVRRTREWRSAPVWSDRDTRAGVTDDDSFALKVQDLFQSYGNEMYEHMADWKFEMCGWSSEGHAGGWRAIEWTTTHRDQVGAAWFLLLFDMAVAAYRRAIQTADVRIVFWFDN